MKYYIYEKILETNFSAILRFAHLRSVIIAPRRFQSSDRYFS